MKARIQFTPQAAEDLDNIWWVIAEDNRDAADRVEMEILATCHRLAKHPRIGTKRQDITPFTGAVLDRHEIPQLCDRLPPGNRPVAGGRRAAWKARPGSLAPFVTGPDT